MPELEINRSTVNSVMRIEICLPRVFPWKLRGGVGCATDVVTSSITDIGGEQ
ncbi:MAG: hypothetical protein K0Q83_3372 [Deltaproteobacteria bacterium]|jgi:hypothetical protein|nr:hypothetical protein [Deltaproteobacteria bacterium]